MTISVTATVKTHRLTLRTCQPGRAVPVAPSSPASAGSSAARCASISRRARRSFSVEWHCHRPRLPVGERGNQAARLDRM